MPFETEPYMEWAHTKPKVRYNLANSAVEEIEPEELDFTWEGIRFSGPNQYGFVPQIEAIAGHCGVAEENVATACGSTMANFLVCNALIQPGDEVIVEKPCYGPLRALPLALGARLKRLERRFEEGYRIDVREIERLASRRTRLIILTNLHNPSGVQIPGQTLEAIAGIAETLNIHVLVDEVYLDFLPGKSRPSCFHISRRFVSTNSLTKAYGLDGLRCGWVLADERLVRRLWRIRDYVDANGPFAAEMISARLFPRVPEILLRTRRIVERNRPLVERFISSHPDLDWVPPDGGVICFPRHRSRRKLNKVLQALPERHDTLVVPGKFFEAPGHFRLGFGMQSDVLRGGLRRLRRAFRED